METTDFHLTPPQIRSFLIYRQKTVTRDYVGDLYRNTKFGANPPKGASGQMREK